MPRHLQHIEAELGSQVFAAPFLIGHHGAELLAQFRELDGHGAVDEWVAMNIGNIVRQRSCSECQFIDVGRFEKQILLEFAGAHIMRQVAEQMASEGIVAHILQHRTAVGIGVRLAQFLQSRLRIAAQQQRPNTIVPYQIDQLLMGQNGVGICGQDTDPTSKQAGEDAGCGMDQLRF